MVQREVADRFFAVPGTKAYGAVSVLVQLAAERTGFHAVSREVFRPRPNVDSALVAFRRRPLPDGFADVKRVVEAAFAHRRKTLPNSIELAGLATRARAQEALATLGVAAATRAEALEPAAFVELERAAAVTVRLAHAKINLALVVGPVGASGKHELTTVFQRVGLADRLELEPADALAVEGFEDDTLVRGALEALAGAAAVEPAWRVRIEKEIPVAAGLGGGSSDAAAALALANETLDQPLPPDRLHDLAARLGADVPFFLASGPQLGEGDGSRLTPVEIPQGRTVVLVIPGGAAKESTASVYRAFDERNGADGYAGAPRGPSGRAGRRRPRRSAAQRPCELAARRPARGARRAPGRRQRRRSGGLRPVRRRGGCGRSCPRLSARLAGPGSDRRRGRLPRVSSPARTEVPLRLSAAQARAGHRRRRGDHRRDRQGLLGLDGDHHLRADHRVLLPRRPHARFEDRPRRLLGRGRLAGVRRLLCIIWLVIGSLVLIAAGILAAIVLVLLFGERGPSKTHGPGLRHNQIGGA